jgi:hypothetical protein
VQPRFVPEVRNVAPENFDREFADEAAADSFVVPVTGPLVRPSRFSFRRVEDSASSAEEISDGDGCATPMEVT